MTVENCAPSISYSTSPVIPSLASSIVSGEAEAALIAKISPEPPPEPKKGVTASLAQVALRQHTRRPPAFEELAAPIAPEIVDLDIDQQLTTTVQADVALLIGVDQALSLPFVDALTEGHSFNAPPASTEGAPRASRAWPYRTPTSVRPQEALLRPRRT